MVIFRIISIPIQFHFWKCDAALTACYSFVDFFYSLFARNSLNLSENVNDGDSKRVYDLYVLLYMHTNMSWFTLTYRHKPEEIL